MESELLCIGQDSISILLSLDAQLTCQLYLHLYLLYPVLIVVSLWMYVACVYVYVCYLVMSVSGRRITHLCGAAICVNTKYKYQYTW